MSLDKKRCDIEIDFWGIFKPEAFAGKNFTFLNNNVPEDVIFYFRHTNDYFLDLVYGKETFGYPVAEFKTSVRNRAVWGSPSMLRKHCLQKRHFLMLNLEITIMHYRACFSGCVKFGCKLVCANSWVLDLKINIILLLAPFPLSWDAVFH